MQDTAIRRIPQLPLKQEHDEPPSLKKNDWSYSSSSVSQSSKCWRHPTTSLDVWRSDVPRRTSWSSRLLPEAGQVATLFLGRHHHNPVLEQGWNVWLLHLPGNQTTLHRWQRTCESPAQQAHINHSRWKSPRPWSTMECSQPAAWTSNRSLLLASRVRPFQEDRPISARPYRELRTWMVMRSGVISVFPTHSENAPASPDIRPTTWFVPHAYQAPTPSLPPSNPP